MHGYHGSDYRLRVESLSTFLRAWKHRAEVIAAEVRAISGWARRRRRHKRCRHWALGCAIYGRRLGFWGGPGNYSFGTSSVMPTWSRWLLRMPFACTILSTEEP